MTTILNSKPAASPLTRGLAPGWIPGADRSYILDQPQSNGTDIAETTRLAYHAITAITSPRIVFVNWNGQQVGPAPITVTASIEYPSGSGNLFQVTFNGGSTSVVIQPGGTVISDPCGIDIPQGAVFWTRQFVSVAANQIQATTLSLGANTGTGGTTRFWKVTATNAYGETIGSNELSAAVGGTQSQVLNWTQVSGATGYKIYGATGTGGQTGATSLVATIGSGSTTTYTDNGSALTTGAMPTANSTGGKWMRGWPSLNTPDQTTYNEGTNSGPSATDLTMTGSGPTVTYAYVFRPWMILSSAASAASAASPPVVALIGDSIMMGTNDDQGRILGIGWAARAMYAAKIPYIQMGHTGQSAGGFINGSRWRLPALSGCSYAIHEYGTNDVNGGSTLAQVQASMITNWTLGQMRGLKQWQITILPRTSFSAGAQTVRNNLNAWIRDGAPLNLTTSPYSAVATGTASSSTCTRAGQTASNGVSHPLNGPASPFGGGTGWLETALAVETSSGSNTWIAAYQGDGTHPSVAGHVALGMVIPTSLIV